MNRYDLSMMLATFALILVAILMGCRPWNLLKKQGREKIDIDISVDYCQRGTDESGTDGEKYCVPILELDNVEEIVLV